MNLSVDLAANRIHVISKDQHLKVHTKMIKEQQTTTNYIMQSAGNQKNNNLHLTVLCSFVLNYPYELHSHRMFFHRTICIQYPQSVIMREILKSWCDGHSTGCVYSTSDFHPIWGLRFIAGKLIYLYLCLWCIFGVSMALSILYSKLL